MTREQIYAQNAERTLRAKAGPLNCRHCKKRIVLYPQGEVVETDAGGREYIHIWVHDHRLDYNCNGIFCGRDAETEAEPLDVIQ